MFTYGLLVRRGMSIFLSLASRISVCNRYLALSSPLTSMIDSIESIHSSVSCVSLSGNCCLYPLPICILLDYYIIVVFILFRFEIFCQSFSLPFLFLIMINIINHYWEIDRSFSPNHHFFHFLIIFTPRNSFL